MVIPVCNINGSQYSYYLVYHHCLQLYQSVTLFFVIILQSNTNYSLPSYSIIKHQPESVQSSQSLLTPPTYTHTLTHSPPSSLKQRSQLAGCRCLAASTNSTLHTSVSGVRLGNTKSQGLLSWCGSGGDVCCSVSCVL